MGVVVGQDVMHGFSPVRGARTSRNYRDGPGRDAEQQAAAWGASQERRRGPSAGADGEDPSEDERIITGEHALVGVSYGAGREFFSALQPITPGLLLRESVSPVPGVRALAAAFSLQ